MALDMILLGFLETPASGYDLRKAFDETVRHFWDAKLSQIYPTLHRLRRDGLVSVSREPSDRGPDRKVYARTPAGTDALRSWLKDSPAVDDQRIEYLAKLFFLGQQGEPERTRRFLEDLRGVFQKRLATFQAIRASHIGDGNHPAGLTEADVHPYLTLLFGLRRTQAAAEWCEECLELLSSLESKEEGDQA